MAIELQSDAMPPAAWGLGSLAIGVGLLTGAVFLAGGALSVVGPNGSRLPAIAIVLGIAVLIKTFGSSGVEFQDRGICVWTVTFWFRRQHRYIEKAEIKECALRESDGKYSAAIVLKSGGSVSISKQFTLFKEAQAYINQCAAHYGVSAGIQLGSPKSIEQAAVFSKCETWTASIDNSLIKKVILLTGADEALKGEIRVTGKEAEITGADGEAGSAWTAKAGFWGRGKVEVIQEGSSATSTVHLKSDFIGERIDVSWTDPGGAEWSAFLTSNSGLRSAYAIKFYRGIFSDDDADRGVAAAVVAGTTSEFTLEIADPGAKQWIRLAIAALWIQYPPADR